MSKEILLSIDLGTYQTKVFKHENGQTSLVKGQTSTYIPTQIGFENGKRVFGDFAVSYAKYHPDCVATNFMAFLGLHYSPNLKD